MLSELQYKLGRCVSWEEISVTSKTVVLFIALLLVFSICIGVVVSESPTLEVKITVSLISMFAMILFVIFCPGSNDV